MRWGAFFGTTLVIVILLSIQWPKIKKIRKKDKRAFFILLFMGWGLSMFDIPHMTGPTTWLETFFRPFGKFME